MCLAGGLLACACGDEVKVRAGSAEACRSVLCLSMPCAVQVLDATTGAVLHTVPGVRPCSGPST